MAAVGPSSGMTCNVGHKSATIIGRACLSLQGHLENEGKNGKDKVPRHGEQNHLFCLHVI